MKDITNSDFDINILEDSTKKPNVDLTFPLPTDKDTYVSLDGNEKLSNSWGILNNFFRFFSGGNVEFDSIYADNEYKYSINKQTSVFNKKMENYMNDKLENSDKMLNKIVKELIERELSMNLTKPEDFNKRFKIVKGFMVKYYREQNKKNMPHYRSHFFVRICYITVMKLMSKMFPSGVWVNSTDFSELFRKYLRDPMSIVFLPNHQSHVDYIIMHLVAIRFELSMPVVIAGENLNVAVFGGILKNLGAIFIKRSFNNELYTERNLSNIIEFFLVNKVHLELFIEGTRSRDGKLLLPKYGVLKTLTNIYYEQRTESNKDFDMLMQPVAITYERTYEADGYLNELIGKNKKQESFMGIINNGVKNLTSKGEVYDYSYFQNIAKTTGEYDNSTRTLSGKIFVKLGDNFTLSSFLNDPKNLIDRGPILDESGNGNGSLQKDVNLKKLGFTILHEVNRCSFLPPVSIAGSTIQAYIYFKNKREFPVTDLIPIFKTLVTTFKDEGSYNRSTANIKLLNDLSEFSDVEVVNFFKQQIPQFFRFVKINLKTGVIKIVNPIELLFYKNLSIHLIIHKSLFCFIASSLREERLRSVKNVHKLFYIFTGFLKHEFLFDYNYNDRNQVTVIFKELIQNKRIEVDKGKFIILDKDYFDIYSEVALPFVESYSICVDNLIALVKDNRPGISNDEVNFEEYPTTKKLLKNIQITSKDFYHTEAINKQYLLSCLYYLNNLKLINIFKNKALNQAYVRVTHSKNLNFVLDFLQVLCIEEDQSFLNETTINYMIDIIDKNFMHNGAPVKL